MNLFSWDVENIIYTESKHKNENGLVGNQTKNKFESRLPHAFVVTMQ